jgi:hypothetical protein
MEEQPSADDGGIGKLPAAYTPEQVAAHLGCSPRKLRSLAREFGCCSIVGNRMTLTEKDVLSLMEACRPKPTAQAPEGAGRARGKAALSDYERLLIERGRQEGLKEAARRQRRSMKP